MKQAQILEQREMTRRRGVASRILGAGLFLVSAGVFAFAGSATSGHAQGLLEICGIALLSLAFTLLITGLTFERERSDDDSRGT